MMPFKSAVDLAKPTSLKGFKATSAEQDYAERFTRIVRISKGNYRVWLKVGNQSFQTGGIDTVESLKHARWHCWMLAKALLKVGPQS